MTSWTVEPLNDIVETELLALPKDMQARFLRITELVETFGPHQVGMPHVRPLRDKLWEMRLTGKSGIGRTIYVAAVGKRLIILHAFVKKTEKTPKRAINTALARMKTMST